jgi:hypothetical protein
VLIRTVPWWEGEYAADVKKSISHHLPGRKTEIVDLVGSPSLTKFTPPAESGQVEEVRPL